MAHTESMQSLTGKVLGGPEQFTLVTGLNVTEIRFVPTLTNGRVDAVMMQSPPPSGQAAASQIAFSGVVKVKAGGVILPNDRLASDASGEAVPDPGANQFGIALTGGQAGEIVSVLMKHQD